MPSAHPPSPVVLAAIVVAGLGANVGTQLLLCRLRFRISPWRQQFVSFGCGLLLTAAGLVLGLHHQPVGPADYLGRLALNLSSYVFLGFCFFNAINLNLSSLRIRMLKEYYRQSPLPLSDALLTTRYPVGEMLEVRLGRLEAGGQIRCLGGRYHSQHGSTVWIGRLFTGLRQVLGFRPSAPEGIKCD